MFIFSLFYCADYHPCLSNCQFDLVFVRFDPFMSAFTFSSFPFLPLSNSRHSYVCMYSLHIWINNSVSGIIKSYCTTPFDLAFSLNFPSSGKRSSPNISISGVVFFVCLSWYFSVWSEGRAIYLHPPKKTYLSFPKYYSSNFSKN